MGVKLAFIGNCQIQTWAYLCDMLLADAEVRSFDFSLRSSREAANQEHFFSRLHEVDWILVQPNVFPYARIEVLRERHGAKVFGMSNFYFRGFFPDTCYVGAFGQRLDQPTAYNSLVVLESFLAGYSQEEAVRAFNPDNYMRLGLYDGWLSSIEEMVHRDQEVDLAGAPFLERLARESQCFYTVNHPALFLLKSYLGQVFDLLGIRWRDYESRELRDPLTDLEILPVADEIAEYFNLPYRTSQSWKVGYPTFRFLNRRGFVAAFYDAYAKADRDTLKVHSPKDMVTFLREREDLAGLAYVADPA